MCLRGQAGSIENSSRITSENGTYGSLNTFTATAVKIFETFLFDRQIKRGSDNKKYRRTFNGYEDTPRPRDYQRQSISGNNKNVPLETSIVCNKKGCHSSQHSGIVKEL